MTDQEKIDRLTALAERAIFWIYHAAMIAEDKEDEVFFESKVRHLQKKLKELKMNNEQALRNAQRNETEEEIMNQELTHREKAFSDAMIEIKKMAANAAEEAVDAIYMKYLPHVEDDTACNAYYIATAIVRNIIAGDITVQSDRNWFSVRDDHGSQHFFNIDRPSVLDALVSAMGEEIQSARIRQLEGQLACLRMELMR